MELAEQYEANMTALEKRGNYEFEVRECRTSFEFFYNSVLK